MPARINRRRFLLGCSALTLTAGLAPAACWSKLRQLQAVRLEQIRFAAFSDQVGTVFHLPQPPAAALELIEAKLTPQLHPLAHLAADAPNEKFSLLFCGPRLPVLAQDTHVFEHPALGRFELFIVPVRTKDPSRRYYQAVFNRPAPEISA